MAFDQTSLPNDLRPINIVGNVAEEPRIAPVSAVSRPPPEGYYGNPVREMGSPVFYPANSEAGFGGVYGNPTPTMTMWAPPGSVPVAYQSMSPSVGYGYNPNLATRVAYGGPGDLVGSVSSNVNSGLKPNIGNLAATGVDLEAVSGIGYAPNLNPNIRVSANPAEQIQSDPVHGFGYIQNPSNRVGNPVDHASDEIGEDSVSGKKVKFLCSFGGKILPRPSDGLLRYVGGHTRIISVRRDVSYTELVQKMFDTYGQPVYIKYQLPDEDLDALVSVSCTDDLDNMMDEYEKLNERSSDGSGKLRVFLFSHSELDPSGMVQFGNLQDTNGQRYVDAVNGIADWAGGAGNAVARKESITSATSTHSDFSGNEAVDTYLPGQGDFNGAFLRKQNSGNSDDISPSLRVPIKPGPPRASSPRLEVDLKRSVPLTLAPQQLGLQQPGMEIPAPGYVQADYRQLPHQMGFPSPQLHGNTTGALTHQYIPSSHVAMRQSVVQPMLQTQPPLLDNFVDELGYGARVVQMPVEPSYTSYQIPVPPSVVGGNYRWHQMVSHQPVMYADAIPRPDCYMCHKALPHAHSDTVAQGKRDTPSDSGLGFHSLRSDDHSRTQPLTRVIVSGASGETAHLDPQGGNFQPEASGFVQNPEEKVEHSRISAPPNGAFVGAIPQTRDDPVQQHVIPGQYVVRPDAVNRAVNREIPPTEYSNMFPGIPPSEDNVETCVTYDQMRPIEIRTGNLRMGPTETSVRQEHSELPVKPQYAPASRLAEPYEVAQPPLWGDPDSYAQSNPSAPPSAPPLAPPLAPNDVHFVDPAFMGVDQSPSLSPTSRIGDAQDSSSSLFSNQDPWNMRQDTQFPPPRPGKTPTKRDSFVSKDPFGNNAELNSAEDGVAQTSSALSSKELGSEYSVSAKGSAEEQIRNDLQAVAEGVAASVLQSANSGPELHVKTELGDESIQEADVGNKPEDAKSKFPEKANKGFPVSDGIGRLQIIKNVDLEELKELGSGTFGTVYHAKWRGTDVAIKRINDRCFVGKPSEQERMRDDFWNEAIKLADLHHPNVLAFYGVVLDGPGGSVATVTEYMVNGSLRNALQKNEKSLDKRKRLLIAMDVAFGMEYLHGKNIVHFDLKSDNLLVNLRDPHRPICKVGDLGLSKVKCQTLISGGVRGTLPWMAPELLNGSSSLVSEKVDVFSYGIVMWELLTGEEPYADLHYGAIIGGIVSNTLRPPIPELCDADWKSVMERCWSSEPSERPSFTEIANQLRSIAAKIPAKGQVSPQHQTPTSQSSV